MLKKAFDSIQNFFGFKGGKQAEFDDAMLSILKAIADSRLYLTTQKPEQFDANKGRELAHAWSEAAVKVNRLNDELREHCLELAKTFSGVQSRDTEHTRADLDQIDTIFTKVREFLREVQNRPVLATKQKSQSTPH